MNSTSRMGFSLIELMVVVAIVGVLAAIAFPEYSQYVSRTKALGTMAETESLRLAVVACMADTGRVAGCNGGTDWIPADASFISTKNTLSAIVKNGEIAGISGATAPDGTSLTYKMVPQHSGDDGKIGWLTTGTICNSVRGLRPGFGGCA